MPRYFFHIHDGEDRPDEDGTEFPGPDEARSEAVVAMGSMLKDLGGTFWDGHDWRMSVTDWQGRPVCTLNVAGQRF